MADTKLSALTELDAAPASTDELYINDGGVSKKITVANLMKGGGGGTSLTGSAGSEALISAGTDTPAGNARGKAAVDLQNDRSSADQVASGPRAVICGGMDNKASGSLVVICGGRSNIVYGNGSSIGGGQYNTASGLNSIIPGGQGAQATHNGELAIGISSGTADYPTGQWGCIPIWVEVTDATKTKISYDNSKNAAVIIPAKTAWNCTLRLVAHQLGSQSDPATASWTIPILISRAGSSAAVLAGGGIGIVPDLGTGTAWRIDVTIGKSGSQHYLYVEFTGEAAHTVRVAGTIEYTRVQLYA